MIMLSKGQSITEELREAWADADHGMCLGFQRCERAVEVACVELDRLRKIAAKYELLCEDGDQCAELVATAYDEWDPDIPWFRQLDCAVAEYQQGVKP